MQFLASFFGALAIIGTVAEPARAAIHFLTGQVESLRGQPVDLFTYLLSEGADARSMSHDLLLDPPLTVRARPDGSPECVSSRHALRASFLPPGCEGARCTGVSVAVDMATPIDFGTTLYWCVVDVAPGTAPGYYPVALANAYTTDVAGQPLPTTAQDGTIAVPELPKSAVLRIGSAEGAPGDTVSFDAIIETTIAAQVIGAFNLIEFDLQLRVPAGPDGQPVCTANPVVGQPASFDFSPPQCVPDRTCDGVYVDVGDTSDPTAFPSGSVMYTCSVTISPDAAPGTYPLLCSALDVIDYESPIGSHCADGEIRVLAPGVPSATPTRTATALPTPSPRATATGTHTAMATARTPPRAHDQDDGCAIAAPRTPAPWLLLLPVAVALRRGIPRRR